MALHWFFALSEYNSRCLSSYERLASVAVLSAQEHTSLIPHCVYDGQESEFTRWLKSRGVTVTQARTPHFEQFRELGQRNDVSFFGIASGTFLRAEVPAVASQLGVKDEYALYTDVDVMFQNEVDLASYAPALFAAAPESDQADYLNFNAGVMLMNLEALANEYSRFQQYVGENLDRLFEMSWDQGVYRELFAGRWDPLPPEYNWKPYWGANPAAKIIHFHGPKPVSRPIPEGGDPVLIALANSAFYEFCEQWDRYVVPPSGAMRSWRSLLSWRRCG
jgi:hypothetical protein